MVDAGSHGMKRRSSGPCQRRGVRSLLDSHREGATCCAAGRNALSRSAVGLQLRPESRDPTTGRRILGLDSIGTRIRYTPPHREERVRIVPRIALRILDAPCTNRTCDPLLRSRQDCVREPIASHRTLGTTRVPRFAPGVPMGWDGEVSRTHPVHTGAHQRVRSPLRALPLFAFLVDGSVRRSAR